MKPIERISIDVPIDPKRRDACERAVFAKLATARAPGVPARRWPWVGAGLAAAAIAAVILVLLLPGASPVAPIVPSLVVTPAGGSSRFTIDDVVVATASDTAVLVARDANQATTLTLVRGTVDCEVPPRGSRAAFQVIAGDVVVEVVGTRFSVARRGDEVRVDVMHGLVAVIARGHREMVSAGGSWSTPPSRTTELPAPPAPVPAPAAAAPIVKRSSTREAFLTAQRLEATDPRGAARAYRAVANGADRWAALALLGLAELHSTTAPRDALQAIAELERRFPASSNLEDAVWLRVEILSATGGDARAAAAAYLRRYPRGTYAAQAAGVAE